jgi:hypothetical protein
MQLTDVRATVANLGRTTPEALHARQKELYREPALRADGLVGHRGRDSGPPATAKTTGMLVIAAMLGDNRFTIGRRVTRLWLAQFEKPGFPCPVTQQNTLGGAVAVILERPDLCVKLDYIEIAHEYEAVSLAWRAWGRRRRPPSVFHPHDPAEWEQRRQEARTHGDELTHLTRLPGISMLKISNLLVAEPAS